MGNKIALNALATNTLKVKIEEATAQALPPDHVATERQAAILANGEARGPDGASLGWIVELELLICCNVACSANRIC